MSKNMHRFAVLLAGGVFVSAMALAEKPDAYQVTGNVVEVSSSLIVVMKGKERFEIARDAGSKVPADVKVGDKVTVHFRMTATNVEAKAAKAPAKAKKAA
ncbi:MAG: hypothetical protein ABI592_00520 [Acidobacteriota bacterium]